MRDSMCIFRLSRLQALGSLFTVTFMSSPIGNILYLEPTTTDSSTKLQNSRRVISCPRYCAITLPGMFFQLDGIACGKPIISRNHDAVTAQSLIGLQISNSV